MKKFDIIASAMHFSSRDFFKVGSKSERTISWVTGGLKVTLLERVLALTLIVPLSFVTEPTISDKVVLQLDIYR